MINRTLNLQAVVNEVVTQLTDTFIQAVGYWQILAFSNVVSTVKAS